MALSKAALHGKAGLDDVAHRAQNALNSMSGRVPKVISRRQQSIGTKIMSWLHPREGESSSDEEESGEERGVQGPRARLPQKLTRIQNTVFFEADLSTLAMSAQELPPCITNPRIWWRHPALRLVTVCCVLVTDFYIYGADPVQDSFVKYPYFGVFEDMFILKWPENPAHRASRIILVILITVFSMWFGQRVVHHCLLRDFLGLSMFAGDRGVLLVNAAMFILFFEYVLPYPVNLIETGTIEEPITEDSVMTYWQWGVIWQSMAATFDMISIVFITDAVLQDRTVWPDWGKRVKWLWNDAYDGWVRVLATWCTLGMCLPVLIYFFVTGKFHERSTQLAGGTSQVRRVAITCFLTMLDITTCLQDWEFPSFNTPADFKVAGSFLSEIHCACFHRILKPISKYTNIPDTFWEIFHFRMSGKWLAFLPAFGALAGDWWYISSTIHGYYPVKVGEYTDPDKCFIYVIRDEGYLADAYKNGVLIEENENLISWESRRGHPHDMRTSSRYCEPFEQKNLCRFFLGLSIASGVAFAFLIMRAEHYWDTFTVRNKDMNLQHRIAKVLRRAAGKRESVDSDSSGSESGPDQSALGAAE